MARNRNHEGRNLCQLCNHEDIDNNPLHLSSQNHRFNFMLFEWNNYRKALVRNRNGVEIDAVPIRYLTNNGMLYETLVNSGAHIIKVTPSQFEQHNEGLKYSFKISNIQRTNNIYLTSAILLHPSMHFRMLDPKGHLHDSKILELEPNASYEILVTFTLQVTALGSYAMPIVFNFQTKTKPEVSFTISREMKIIISEDVLIDNSQNLSAKSPFTNTIWKDISVYLPPTKNQRIANMYPVPAEHLNALKAGLHEYNYMTDDDIKSLEYLRKQLEPGYPTIENYGAFFHTLLWLDETGASIMLSRYNMEDVTMRLIEGTRFLELEVPGLAEKRPSLIIGDMVNIRFHEDHTVYMGIVKKVNDTTIYIGHVNEELITAVDEQEDIELDVSFVLSRLCYERMHEAVNNCIYKGFLPTLFPSNKLTAINVRNSYIIEMHEYYNKDILNNQEQKVAVNQILNRSSQTAPYIVFGPPGTGKTITIVEAILQIKSKIKDARILVCAPANSACDMLATKLVENCTKKELIRIHSDSRDWSTVPEEIKPYSNHDGKEYTRVLISDIVKYRIVVTTLILCGKYSGKYHADYIFIDEAAQALEPEANIAISMMRRHDSGVILAGDPEQLGPICSSSVAEKYNLGVSLLERLMKENSLYQSYNSNFITMLKLNFRTHPQILSLPNELFYNNELKAVSQFPLLDPIANLFISNTVFKITNKKKVKNFPGQPIEFCAVSAKERREGKSPSYFNEMEVQTVIKYIKALMTMELNVQHKVKESEIGIITPYIRQMYRIKERLRQNGFSNIEVGTTESFQGREKRIIIISTVRAQHSLLLFDRRYNLGFVKNEKRFNVALTRAMSKLIVIGCPIVLGTDKKWLEYILLCQSLHAYFGPQYQRRNLELKQDVTKRFANVHRN